MGVSIPCGVMGVRGSDDGAEDADEVKEGVVSSDAVCCMADARDALERLETFESGGESGREMDG